MEHAYDVEKKYLTQHEVAERFRVTPSTVKNWRDQGKLVYFQAPGSTRVIYPLEAIEEFERQHTTQVEVVERKKPAEIRRIKPGVSSIRQKEWRV